MKTSSIITGLLIILTSSLVKVNAQSFDDPAVKILPTTQKGIVKVHFAYGADQKVNVRFFNEDGQLYSDEVKGSFPNGFSKKYDIRKMNGENLWIEITCEAMSVTYKLVRSEGRDEYVPFLENSTYNHVLVAKKS
ncbi:hypothetical protein BH10BAC4_BH10BAC4_06000 [soil metagenome]